MVLFGLSRWVYHIPLLWFSEAADKLVRILFYFTAVSKASTTLTSQTAAPLSAGPCWLDSLPDTVQVTLAAATKLGGKLWPQQSNMLDTCLILPGIQTPANP
jgi:hypothetical protein